MVVSGLEGGAIGRGDFRWETDVAVRTDGAVCPLPHGAVPADQWMEGAEGVGGGLRGGGGG